MLHTRELWRSEQKSNTHTNICVTTPASGFPLQLRKVHVFCVRINFFVDKLEVSVESNNKLNHKGHFSKLFYSTFGNQRLLAWTVWTSLYQLTSTNKLWKTGFNDQHSKLLIKLQPENQVNKSLWVQLWFELTLKIFLGTIVKPC